MRGISGIFILSMEVFFIRELRFRARKEGVVSNSESRGLRGLFRYANSDSGPLDDVLKALNDGVFDSKVSLH